MWKPEHRRAAVRHGLRYPSDLTDAEWVLVEPMIPPAKRGGRRREVNVREVLNAIFYLVCACLQLAGDINAKVTDSGSLDELIAKLKVELHKLAPTMT
jgi:hypothetical protein